MLAVHAWKRHGAWEEAGLIGVDGDPASFVASQLSDLSSNKPNRGMKQRALH